MIFNWFKKKECPEGSIHAWEYDGQLFKSEEERDRYKGAHLRERKRKQFIFTAKTHLANLLIRNGYQISQSEQLAGYLAMFLYDTPGVIDFLKNEKES